MSLLSNNTFNEGNALQFDSFVSDVIYSVFFMINDFNSCASHSGTCSCCETFSSHFPAMEIVMALR